jgi:thiosulfate/3-mercaptopyruvate sulfurtransferase
MHNTIVSAAELVPHLDDANWLIVDCRFDLTRPAAGEEAYGSSHIPGAVYAHLDRDLSSPITPTSGRHPLPTPQQFAATLGRWGVTSRTQIVAYDADVGSLAARLWWLSRWIGHENIAVLDGGFKAWQAAALAVTTALPSRTATQFEPHPARDAWLDAAQVAERVQRKEWRLLDARAPERFAGAVEPLDPVAGHVTGARNHPFASSIGADGRFLSAAQLRERFATSQAGVADDYTIAMCGSGVTACHLLLALEIAGKTGAKLYAGSWSEWIRDTARPVSKGSGL